MSKEIETIVPVGQPRLVRQSSDTPETDSQLGSLANAPDDTCAWMELGLPRGFERERNELRAKYATHHNEAENLTAENKRLRGAIERLEYERAKREPYKDDAPGHLHNVRSHWDMDGALCSWCDAWDQARAALHSLPNAGVLAHADEKLTDQ